MTVLCILSLAGWPLAVASALVFLLVGKAIANAGKRTRTSAGVRGEGGCLVLRSWYLALSYPSRVGCRFKANILAARVEQYHARGLVSCGAS